MRTSNFVLALTTALFISALPSAGSAKAGDETPAVPAPCQLIEVTNVDMMTSYTGEVGVPVKIHGKEAVLLVDTGSVFSSISLPLVRELNLPQLPLPRGMFAFFAGGVQVRQITKFDTISIGAAHGENAIFLVEPPAVSDYDHDGLLGPDIMHQYDVEFDFAGGKFKMFAPEQCAGNVVYWTKSAYALVPMKVGAGWHVTVPLMLDGKPLDAVIDTGSARSLLTMEAASELFGLDEKSSGMVSLGNFRLNRNSGTPTYRYPFKAMNFNGVTVLNPDLLLVPKAQLGGRQAPSAVIGISILRQLHLYIAYKEQKLYVTPAQVIEPPPTPLPSSPTPSQPAPAKPPATAPIASSTSPAQQN